MGTGVVPTQLPRFLRELWPKAKGAERTRQQGTEGAQGAVAPKTSP